MYGKLNHISSIDDLKFRKVKTKNKSLFQMQHTRSNYRLFLLKLEKHIQIEISRKKDIFNDAVSFGRFTAN